LLFLKNTLQNQTCSVAEYFEGDCTKHTHTHRVEKAMQYIVTAVKELTQGTAQNTVWSFCLCSESWH